MLTVSSRTWNHWDRSRCFISRTESTSTDFIPLFRGIPLTADKGVNVKIVNIDLRKQRTDLLEPDTNHINIDKNMKLHTVLDKICKELKALS